MAPVSQDKTLPTKDDATPAAAKPAAPTSSVDLFNQMVAEPSNTREQAQRSAPYTLQRPSAPLSYSDVQGIEGAKRTLQQEMEKLQRENPNVELKAGAGVAPSFVLKEEQTLAQVVRTAFGLKNFEPISQYHLDALAKNNPALAAELSKAGEKPEILENYKIKSGESVSLAATSLGAFISARELEALKAVAEAMRSQAKGDKASTDFVSAVEREQKQAEFRAFALRYQEKNNSESALVLQRLQTGQTNFTSLTSGISDSVRASTGDFDRSCRELGKLQTFLDQEKKRVNEIKDPAKRSEAELTLQEQVKQYEQLRIGFFSSQQQTYLAHVTSLMRNPEHGSVNKSVIALALNDAATAGDLVMKESGLSPSQRVVQEQLNKQVRTLQIGNIVDSNFKIEERVREIDPKNASRILADYYASKGSEIRENQEKSLDYARQYVRERGILIEGPKGVAGDIWLETTRKQLASMPPDVRSQVLHYVDRIATGELQYQTDNEATLNKHRALGKEALNFLRDIQSQPAASGLGFADNRLLTARIFDLEALTEYSRDTRGYRIRATETVETARSESKEAAKLFEPQVRAAQEQVKAATSDAERIKAGEALVQAQAKLVQANGIYARSTEHLRMMHLGRIQADEDGKTRTAESLAALQTLTHECVKNEKDAIATNQTRLAQIDKELATASAKQKDQLANERETLLKQNEAHTHSAVSLLMRDANSFVHLKQTGIAQQLIAEVQRDFGNDPLTQKTLGRFSEDFKKGNFDAGFREFLAAAQSENIWVGVGTPLATGAIGAAIGTAICPGPGTGVGFIIGSAVGLLGVKTYNVIANWDRIITAGETGLSDQSLIDTIKNGVFTAIDVAGVLGPAVAVTKALKVAGKMSVILPVIERQLGQELVEGAGRQGIRSFASEAVAHEFHQAVQSFGGRPLQVLHKVALPGSFAVDAVSILSDSKLSESQQVEKLGELCGHTIKGLLIGKGQHLLSGHLMGRGSLDSATLERDLAELRRLQGSPEELNQLASSMAKDILRSKPALLQGLNPSVEGPLTSNQAATGIRTSRDGKNTYVSDPAALQELYKKASEKEIRQQNPKWSEAQVQQELSERTKVPVLAFVDQTTGNKYFRDYSKGATQEERFLAASLYVHETAHQRFKQQPVPGFLNSEDYAWRTQEAWLNERGFQLKTRGNEISVEKASGERGTPLSPEGMRRILTNYSGSELSGQEVRIAAAKAPVVAAPVTQMPAPAPMEPPIIRGDSPALANIANLKESERLIIGRSESAGLRVSSPIVSRVHASIEVKPDGSYVVTNGLPPSSFGTSIEGRPATAGKWEPFSPSDRVLLGEGRLTLSADHMAQLRNEQVLTVGSDPKCDIRIAADGVSRVHATVRMVNGQLEINDGFTPKNPVLKLVNGSWEPIEGKSKCAPGDWIALPDGTRIQLPLHSGGKDTNPTSPVRSAQPEQHNPAVGAPVQPIRSTPDSGHGASAQNSDKIMPGSSGFIGKNLPAEGKELSIDIVQTSSTLASIYAEFQTRTQGKQLTPQQIAELARQVASEKIKLVDNAHEVIAARRNLKPGDNVSLGQFVLDGGGPKERALLTGYLLERSQKAGMFQGDVQWTGADKNAANAPAYGIKVSYQTTQGPTHSFEVKTGKVVEPPARPAFEPGKYIDASIRGQTPTKVEYTSGGGERPIDMYGASKKEAKQIAAALGASPLSYRLTSIVVVDDLGTQADAKGVIRPVKAFPPDADGRVLISRKALATMSTKELEGLVKRVVEIHSSLTSNFDQNRLNTINASLRTPNVEIAADGKFLRGRPLVTADGKINGSVYLSGSGSRPAIVVDDMHQPLIRAEYEKFKAQIERNPSLRNNPEKLLEILKDQVQAAMPNTQDPDGVVVEAYRRGNITIKPGDDVPLDAYLSTKGGVCAHRSLLASYLLEKAKAEFNLDLTVSFDRNSRSNGAHAWVRVGVGNRVIVCDPMHGVVSWISEGQMSYWPYLRPIEIDHIRGRGLTE